LLDWGLFEEYYENIIYRCGVTSDILILAVCGI
jgi:hypothetical protein